MSKSVHLLRAAFYAGAVLDAAMVVPMLIPSVGAAMFGIPDFHPGPEYRYAMGLGASLMAGWTVLLLWGSRQPMERRGLLPITLVPVVLGLAVSNLYAGASGLVAFARLIPMLTLQAALTALFLAAYLHTDPRMGSGS